MTEYRHAINVRQTAEFQKLFKSELDMDGVSWSQLIPEIHILSGILIRELEYQKTQQCCLKLVFTTEHLRKKYSYFTVDPIGVLAIMATVGIVKDVVSLQPKLTLVTPDNLPDSGHILVEMEED